MRAKAQGRRPNFMRGAQKTKVAGWPYDANGPYFISLSFSHVYCNIRARQRSLFFIVMVVGFVVCILQLLFLSGDKQASKQTGYCATTPGATRRRAARGRKIQFWRFYIRTGFLGKKIFIVIFFRVIMYDIFSLSLRTIVSRFLFARGLRAFCDKYRACICVHEKKSF